MGEKIFNDHLDNKDSNNPSSSQPQQNGMEDHDPPEDLEEEDMDPAEFQHLDNQLNALFTALDDIESKNDNIHSQLLELLQANREIRKQLNEESRNEKPENMDTDHSETS